MARKRRKRRRKPMKIMQWFKKMSTTNKVLFITSCVMIILITAGIIYLASLFNKLDRQKIEEDDIIVNELAENVGVGYTNFVLFGSDSRTGETAKNLNTDTIIIVSLNNETKEIKMVSVYRDTLLDLSNGKIQKCNSAYARGGPTRAINMLNMNLDLDIKKYVTVDFGAVAELVDMVGGVEVEVTKAEMKAMNQYIGETARVSGKKAKYIKNAGLQTLDGVQATTYARIRKGVGNDYARTERQRAIIQKVAQKMMKSDWGTIGNMIDTLFPRISTNFTMTEIMSYAKSFTKYQFGETTGFPMKKGSGTIPGKGSSVYPITLKSNVTMLHEFLYGTEDYEPSSKVVEISNEIAYIVANTKNQEDSSDKNNNNHTTTPAKPNENTGDNNQPIEDEQPSEGIQPSEGEEPSEGEPNEGEQPSEGDKPNEGGQPDEDGEPNEGEQPGEDTQPGEGESEGNTPTGGGTRPEGNGGVTGGENDNTEGATPTL